MKSETIFVGVAALVFGLLVGIVIGRYGFGPDTGPKLPQGVGPRGGGPVVPSRNTAPPRAQAPANPQPRIDLARVQALEAKVAADPSDRASWVELGHHYFDGEKQQDAIRAYDRALALDANDANVLTDQGVMYRQTGQFRQAIANFERARTVDPSHLPSLYNLGVVNLYDLNEPDKARAAWEEYARRVPNDPKVEFIRSELARIAAGQPPLGGKR